MNGAVILRWAAHDELRAISAVGVLGLIATLLLATRGLPPTDLHGPLHTAGIMDPLCGGTRAARLTARGDLAEAWRYNPLGIAATLAAAAASLRLVVGHLTHRWITIEVAWTPRRIRTALLLAALTTFLLEVRQQGRADLLLGGS